jgi:hypothetical protein
MVRAFLFLFLLLLPITSGWWRWCKPPLTAVVSHWDQTRFGEQNLGEGEGEGEVDA